MKKIHVPYYTNIKRYMNQLEIGSFNVNLYSANCVKTYKNEGNLN